MGREEGGDSDELGAALACLEFGNQKVIGRVDRLTLEELEIVGRELAFGRGRRPFGEALDVATTSCEKAFKENDSRVRTSHWSTSAGRSHHRGPAQARTYVVNVGDAPRIQAHPFSPIALLRCVFEPRMDTQAT
jgi:hypothetical protein